ncbi:AcrR family transcriptional regulator [Aeribacillus sp. SP014]
MQTKTNTVTKENIVDAAIFLFNTKGYTGTSVREIAKRANANIAHISYYFKGKNGLLEHLVSKFYEGYLDVIDQCYQKCTESPKLSLLWQSLKNFSAINMKTADLPVLSTEK